MHIYSTRFGFVIFMLLSAVQAQQIPPYKNPQLPVEQRVKDLLQRMTPEEKFWQLFMIPGDLDQLQPGQYRNGIFGLQVSASGNGGQNQLLKYNTGEPAAVLAKKINAIQKFFVEQTRLGIPIIAFDEALHGLVRDGATAFPQAIGLAATWDTALMHRVAKTIAAECLQRGIRQILSPVVNLATDVRWGRTEETYGEDPFLASEMAVAFVRAFEQTGIITTPKHFIANVGEGGRDSYPIHISERILREQYLVPFIACFERGGSRSVMTAYNAYDGSPATASDYLLNNVLKKQLNFTGFVISDANAVGGANVLHYTAKDYPDAGKQAITNGLDVIFQTSYDHYKLFIPPFLDSSISPARIDDAVSRVLTAKFQLGLFEHPYINETTNTGSATQKKELAKQAAVSSFVLLKNENGVLPLSGKIKSIAVIGEDAKTPRLGGYSGPGNNVVSILEGIKTRAGSKVRVLYEPGCGRTTEDVVLVPEKNITASTGSSVTGFYGEYFNNIDLKGTPAFTRTDKQINFHWTLYGPDDQKVPAGFFSARWTGTLSTPISGTFDIGLEGNDGYRLYINNKLVINRWKKITVHRELTRYYFEQNRSYHIRVEFYETTGNGQIRLIWNAGVQDDTDRKITAAVNAAKKADVAVVVTGITEGEFQDRALLQLPGKQEELIRRIAATGTPVVVLLTGGSAVIMENWLNKVDAVLNTWYPGEAGGTAVAETLFGDANPAGRLPITVPKHEGQLPLTYNHKPTGRGDDYNNLSGAPAFPFGFGLSYTQFEYSSMRVNKKKAGVHDTITVYCTVKNTGSRVGDEVVQLYIRDEWASVSRPVTELKGFQRISLRPGEAKEISFQLTPALLGMYNVQMEFVTEPGTFRIMIGASSKDIRVREVIEIEE